MPVEERSPTINTTIVKGWLNPANAYSSNDVRTLTGTAGAEQEYAGYGFTVPSDSEIDEVLLKVEGYLTLPADEELHAQWWDGASWYGSIVPLTTVEAIYSKNITSWINTPSKLNALKTRITRFGTVGGCFLPRSEFLGFDGADYCMVDVSNIQVGDLLLGFDGQKFGTTPVTKATKHTGVWNIVQAYLIYPSPYIKATLNHPRLRTLFDLKPNVDSVLSDFAVTDDHPVWVRTKGRIPAKDLQVGDSVGELFWENGLQVGGCQVEGIERFEMKGNVYDIRTQMPFMFGRYLLGHLAKEPW